MVHFRPVHLRWKIKGAKESHPDFIHQSKNAKLWRCSVSWLADVLNKYADSTLNCQIPTGTHQAGRTRIVLPNLGVIWLTEVAWKQPRSLIYCSSVSEIMINSVVWAKVKTCFVCIPLQANSCRLSCQYQKGNCHSSRRSVGLYPAVSLDTSINWSYLNVASHDVRMVDLDMADSLLVRYNLVDDSWLVP